MGRIQSQADSSLNYKKRHNLWIRRRRAHFLTVFCLSSILLGAVVRFSGSSAQLSSLPEDLPEEKLTVWEEEAKKHFVKGKRGKLIPSQPFSEHGVDESKSVEKKGSMRPVKKAVTLSTTASLAPKPIINVTESATCKLPRRTGACRMQERLHVVFVSAMWNREPFTKVETEYMLKSIMYQTNCRLFIHFLVAGQPEVDLIPSMMDSMGAVRLAMTPAPPAPKADARLATSTGDEGLELANVTVLYALHLIPTDWVVERAKGLGLFPLAHHASIPGMCKFFMADILWQVQRAVYLDVDMILAGDIQDLWEFFDEMKSNPKLLYFMGNNHPEGHNKRRLLRPLCSCQLVMDLERMRQANLTQMVMDALDGRKPKSLKEYVEDGDQWLFSWLCRQYKGACRTLPRMWNVSGCSKPVPFLGLGARGQAVNGSCWRIVHFNCMGHVKGRQGSYRVPGAWGEAYRWVKSLRAEQFRNRFDALPEATVKAGL